MRIAGLLKHFFRGRRIALSPLALGLPLALATFGAAGAARESVAAGVREAPNNAASPGNKRLRVNVAAMSATKDGDGYVAPVEGGGHARLTINPTLQQAAEGILAEYALPYGAVVMISVADGRIQVLAGRSELDGKMGPADLALKAWAPAASIFKLVSAAALVTKGGQTPDSKVCYHGGLHGIQSDHLVDSPKLDQSCDSLSYAVGKSQNSIIAKMAIKHLNVDTLTSMAGAFGFGTPIPFVADVDASGVAIPTDRLEFARAAAGFFHTSLSPLHGALIAAAIAGGGVMPRPLLVDSAVDKSGTSLQVPGRRARRVVGEETASQLAGMMEATVRMGTARSGFMDHRGHPFLPYKVAGKTGSLNYRGQLGDPAIPPAGLVGGYLQYTWFVGFAPYEKPEVAFAVALGNPAKWRIKPVYVARRLLSEWDALKKKGETGESAVMAKSPAESAAQ